jgi:hypothetical protein
MSQLTQSRYGEMADTEQVWLIANHTDDQLYDDWWAGTRVGTIEGVPQI